MADGAALEPWRAPAGAIVFAVGDIHGRADLLRLALERLDAHGADALDAQMFVVFLGDYIDRGADSAGVLDLLSAHHWGRAQPFFLRGNHEQALLDFLEDPVAHRAWLNHGGVETLISYGVRAPSLGADAQRLIAARDALVQAMPQAHLSFLHALRDHLILGDYLFVHAGVDPRKTLSLQTRGDLLWVRGRFLNETALYQYCVVHGHTPAPEPYIDGRRIGLDTGAYMSGMLSMVRLEGVCARFERVRQSEGAPLERLSASASVFAHF